MIARQTNANSVGQESKAKDRNDQKSDSLSSENNFVFLNPCQTWSGINQLYLLCIYSKLYLISFTLKNKLLFNAIGLSHHKQLCLIRLRSKRYFSLHQALRCKIILLCLVVILLFCCRSCCDDNEKKVVNDQLYTIYIYIYIYKIINKI